MKYEDRGVVSEFGCVWSRYGCGGTAVKAVVGQSNETADQAVLRLSDSV